MYNNTGHQHVTFFLSFFFVFSLITKCFDCLSTVELFRVSDDGVEPHARPRVGGGGHQPDQLLPAPL